MTATDATGAPWPVRTLAARGVTLAPDLDVAKFCEWAVGRQELWVGTCLSCCQTDAATAEFERAVVHGPPEAGKKWLERYAPSYRDTVWDVQEMIVNDLVDGAEDGILREPALSWCPHRDEMAMALWYRGVRPRRSTVRRLVAALRARARETAEEPDLGASRDEVIDAIRAGELPVATLAEYDRRLVAAREEAEMERLRWWLDRVCRVDRVARQAGAGR